MTLEERTALVRYFVARYDHARMLLHTRGHRLNDEGRRLLSHAAFSAYRDLDALVGNTAHERTAIRW